jgi:histone chaperone ASF1
MVSPQAAAPTLSQIPSQDLIGVTVVLLTASYKDQEFVRIGYYVHTEYDSEELRALEESERPNPPIIERLSRNVLADKPRVTRFNVAW